MVYDKVVIKILLWLSLNVDLVYIHPFLLKLCFLVRINGVLVVDYFHCSYLNLKAYN